MQVIIKTKDNKEAKRLLKADDMASFIFELKYNLWRKFKNTDYDYHIAWNSINELIEEHNIDIDDLWE